MTMMVLCHSSRIFGCLLFLASISHSSSTSAVSSLRRQGSQSQQQQQQQQQRQRQLQSSDASSAYALYSLPPFTLTFTSSHTIAGLPSDPDQRGQLLSATLHEPLKMVTTEFLMESFRIAIAKQVPLRKSQNNSNSTTIGSSSGSSISGPTLEEEEASVQSILDSFMTLDLQVSVRSVDNNNDNSNNNNNGGGSGRFLQSTTTTLITPITTTLIEPELAEPWEQDQWEQQHQQQQQQLGDEPAGETTVTSTTTTSVPRVPNADSNSNSATTSTTTTSSSTTTDSSSSQPPPPPPPPPMLTFQADFFTTAAFLEPTSLRSSTSSGSSSSSSSSSSVPRVKPTNEAVADIMGGFMKTAFDQDIAVYKADLQNTETKILQRIVELGVEPNSEAVYDPFALSGGGGGFGPQPPEQTSSSSSPPTPVDENSQPIIDPTAGAEGSNDGGWNTAEKLFCTLLVMVSILSIAGLLLAFQQYRIRRVKKLEYLQYYGKHQVDDEFSDHHLPPHHHPHPHHRASIGGRHSDEIMDILNASDKYLATHRPDLFEAMERTTAAEHQQEDRHGNRLIPIATNHGSDDPVQRRYVTPTNPFSYLYGASYFHKDRTAVESSRRRKSSVPAEDPMAQVELQLPNNNGTREPVPDDEDLDLHNGRSSSGEAAVSGFMQTWFQNVIGNRRTAATAASKDDGSYEGDGLIDESMDDLVIEECLDQGDGVMACEEDPTDYKFAYQDFPRQDGTPCLIYEETLNEEEEEQYLRNNSRRDSLHSTTSYGVHDPLTDGEFQRALSQHDATDYHMSSSSFERQLDTTPVVSMDEGDDDDVSHDDISSDALNDSHDDDSSQFTNKLEKMVAMRHRHYEKQKIVDRHRDQRKQERARVRSLEKQKQQVEMQERDRRLRRHSMELDIQELEAAVGGGGVSGPPPSASSKVVTPTDRVSGHQQQASWHQQEDDLKQLTKPNMHRRTSSEADMGASSVTTSSAAVGIHTHRSMDVNEISAFDQAVVDGGSPVSLPSMRRVQSARKDRPNSSRSNQDTVFRTDGGTHHIQSTLSPKVGQLPLVSPSSSMTDTGSTTTPSSISGGSYRSNGTPPLMGGGSVRHGSSARKKKREASASAALAKGFQARRSMSFDGSEEKKTGEESASGSPQHRRADSVNSHRRSNSNAPANVMDHGIYAQFV